MTPDNKNIFKGLVLLIAGILIGTGIGYTKIVNLVDDCWDHLLRMD